MEESRLRREDRKVKNYAISYGMTEQQIKDLMHLMRRRRQPPKDYCWPDSFPGMYQGSRIQPIPFGELRGTIEKD